MRGRISGWNKEFMYGGGRGMEYKVKDNFSADLGVSYGIRLELVSTETTFSSDSFPGPDVFLIFF